MTIGALIPVKGFAGAKQRLSSQLSLPEREGLMRAMVYDVLTQVCRARGIDTTFVVTGSSDVVEWVGQLGVEVICERNETGETDAVHFALDEIKHRGLDAALVLPGDLPLVRAADIEDVLQSALGEGTRAPFAALVPSHDRMGTNALLLSPPEVLRLRFGHDSFCYHLNEVVTKRLPINIVENPHIALDVDEPEDLQRILPHLDNGRTYDSLLAMKCNGSRFFRNVG